MDLIPLSRPSIDEAERRAVLEALEGDILHGDGPIGRRVEARLEEELGVAHAYLTTSGTHALEMAVMALGLEDGDEVVMPSFTFTSTATAVVREGGQPVYADVREGSLGLDPDDVARKIGGRTRGILPVHYAGLACDMDRILALAEDHDLWVVEDAAQAIGAAHRGSPLGTLGTVGCLSFHDTKSVTSGEGGAFLTDDSGLARRAELIREKGTNRSAFYRGEVDKYSWVAEGSSYVLSEVLAALLEAQLGRRRELKAGRRTVWTAYRDTLDPMSTDLGLELPVVPEHAEPNYHIFFFHVPEPEVRGKVLEALHEAGIGAAFHYVPLHQSRFGETFLRVGQDLSTTEWCASTLVRLPVYPELAERAEAIAGRVAAVLDDVLG